MSISFPAAGRIKKRRLSFFFIMGLVALAAVHIGFATTYTLPLARGSFKAPFAVHLHGALALSWVMLYLVQSFLIHRHQYRLHRTLGLLGLLIAIGIVLTMIPLGLFIVNRSLAEGGDAGAYSTIVGLFTSGLMFLGFVIAAIIYRRKPAIHKRLVLLALIVLIWPAWFRFRHYFPAVPRPDIWFALVLADSLIIVAWLRDRMATGKIHPVLLYGGLFIILENVFEVMMFDKPWWRQLARFIYEGLNV